MQFTPLEEPPLITLTTFKRATVVAIFASTLAAAATAGATSVAKADLDDLSHIADLIVVGEVQSVQMRQEPTSATIPDLTILTHNAIRVSESWKGAAHAGDVIDVVEAGGIVNGKGFDVVGMPGYKVGERVLLFLQPRRDTTNQYLTLGIFLGKYTLLPNGSNGWKVAQLGWKIDERGQDLDLRKIPQAKFLAGQDLSTFSSKVKTVIEADRAAGIDGKWLPKYDHMGVGR